MSAKSTTLDEQVLEGLAAITATEWEQEDTEDGTTRFVAGCPREVLVDVTNDEVRVYLPEVKWTSPYETEAAPELAGRINLKTHGLSINKDAFVSALQHLVDAARALRRMRFVTCQFCEGEIPPEHQYDEQTCQGCASKELGVVY